MSFKGRQTGPHPDLGPGLSHKGRAALMSLQETVLSEPNQRPEHMYHSSHVTQWQ